MLISASGTKPSRRPGRHPQVRRRFVARPHESALRQGELSIEAAGQQGDGHTVHTHRQMTQNIYIPSLSLLASPMVAVNTFCSYHA